MSGFPAPLNTPGWLPGVPGGVSGWVLIRIMTCSLRRSGRKLYWRDCCLLVLHLGQGATCYTLIWGVSISKSASGEKLIIDCLVFISVSGQVVLWLQMMICLSVQLLSLPALTVDWDSPDSGAGCNSISPRTSGHKSLSEVRSLRLACTIWSRLKKPGLHQLRPGQLTHR